MSSTAITVILPCLNEAESLPAILAALPDGYRALVVDNNSTDGTAAVARAHGAEVVTECQPGYGAAVHAGVLAARTPTIAVLDADGSLTRGRCHTWLRLWIAVPIWPSGGAARCPDCGGRGTPGWAPQ